MNVPASTIVMGLVTCSLFGVAIRETVTAKPPASYDDDWNASGAVGVDEVETELTEATEDEVDEPGQTARVASRRSLLGTDVASLGPSFGHIALGTSIASIENLEQVVNEAESASHSRIAIEGEGKVDRVRISQRGSGSEARDELCELLTEELTLRWGTPEGDTYDARWVNTTTNTRASLNAEYTSEGEAICELVFERFVAPEQWFKKDGSSIVPVWAVGQSVAKLQQAIAPRGVIEWYDEHAELAWNAPGLEHRTGATDLVAYVVKGKVVAVQATVPLSSDETELVAEQITSVRGAATTDDDIVYEWAGKPSVTLLDMDDRVRVTVGKLP